MSYQQEKTFSLKIGERFSFTDKQNDAFLNRSFAEILQNGVHGFCFSLYEEGQKPGDVVSEEQIRRRLAILKPHSNWVRTFSCTEGNELIPKIAKEMGLRTLVGAWLGKDPRMNKEEVENLIKLCRDGVVDIAAVGNEVLYRKDLTEQELLDFIRYVKAEITDIPVGYVDAYYEFALCPEITQNCDVILCNCYPFWEGCSFENSLAHMKAMYLLAKEVAQEKTVMISETGWPSAGENEKEAIPSTKNARDYFINTQLWAEKEGIPVFYFSSFDESWKVGAEGTVGAYWGLWDKHEKLKF
ncbi:MAG: glycosyl hydrolase [Rhodothermia bacterium]|nr:glycosyl hydrolase [Rhodothermia bacterium]